MSQWSTQWFRTPQAAGLLTVLTVCGGARLGEPAEAPRPRAVYHVSPNGADTAPGTLAHPFATLERARDAIRELKKQRGGLPTGGVTVFLRGGVRPRTSTFELTAEDSGAPGAPIVYASAPGETATLFGGVPLRREWFTPVTDATVLERVISTDARGKLLQCDLKAYGITDYGELSRHGYCKASTLRKTPPVMLYVGGKRMTLARWPNPEQHFPDMLWRADNHRKGVVARSGIVEPGPGGNDPDFAERGGTFSYAFDRPEVWTQADDIWLDGVFTWSWEWSYNKIATIDTEKKRITLRYGEVSHIEDKYSGNFFFATFDLATAPHLKKYPEVLPLLPGAPPMTQEQMWHRFEDNVIWNPTVPRYKPGGILIHNKKPEEMPATRISIDPYCRRSIRGISELSRQAYFGLCDNGGTNFDARCRSKERYDWLIKENGITFGRALRVANGLDRWYKAIKEDPARVCMRMRRPMRMPPRSSLSLIEATASWRFFPSSIRSTLPSHQRRAS